MGHILIFGDHEIIMMWLKKYIYFENWLKNT